VGAPFSIDHRAPVKQPTTRVASQLVLALALACARPLAPPPVPSAPPAPPPKPAPGPPVLTQPAVPTALPILDPLLRPDLAVEAQVAGAAGKPTAVWLRVDSGSPQVALPPPLVAELGLPELDQTGLLGERGSQLVPFASLPRLGLGGVSATGVSVAVLSLSATDAARGLLGRSVLAQTAWEVAWSRGTLTLGPKLWPATGATRVLPLAPLERGDGLTVHIAGRATQVVFDTGAVLSMLPESMIKSHGLETASYEGTPIGQAFGPVTASQLIVADVEVGGIRFVRHRFYQGRAGEPPVLGLDLLARFDFQVIPGKSLVLRPREGDLRATAAERIRRWAWMPSCRSVGCAHGRVVGNDKQSRLEIELEASPPRPLQILMGCAGRREREEPAPWTDWTEPPATRGQHLKLQVTPKTGRKVKAAIPGLNFSLTLPDGTACRKLAVLDVAPIPTPPADAPEIVATVVP